MNERTNQKMSDIATQLIAAGAAPATPKPNGSAPDHEAVGWTLDDVMELAVDLGIKPMKFLQDNKGLKPGALMDKLDKIQKKREESQAAQVAGERREHAAVQVPSGPSVVAQVAANVGVTPSALQAEIDRLRLENAALKTAAVATVRLKMSEAGINDKGQEIKGGSLVVSGVSGRFPLVFSRAAVVALFGDPHNPKDPGQFHTLRKFALANWDKFRTKP